MNTRNDTMQSRLLERFGKHFDAGTTIFNKDEPAEQVFMITSGRVRLVKQVRGVLRDIAILKNGDIFGESALLPGQRRDVSAVALGDCELLVLGAEEFDKLIHERSEISVKLVKQLIRRLATSEEQIENMLLRDNQSKIVNTLLKIADLQAEEDGVLRTLSVTPLELASRIGIDVDSVKRGVLHLRKKHYIKIKSEKIEISDIEALRKLYKLLEANEEFTQ